MYKPKLLKLVLIDNYFEPYPDANAKYALGCAENGDLVIVFRTGFTDNKWYTSLFNPMPYSTYLSPIEWVEL